ncbi:MAG: hypothetical protein R8G66_24035 [Cytophagales bacterium]|nr:hypothetical protein [Cytophagales bacterium]
MKLNSNLTILTEAEMRNTNGGQIIFGPGMHRAAQDAWNVVADVYNNTIGSWFQGVYDGIETALEHTGQHPSSSDEE